MTSLWYVFRNTKAWKLSWIKTKESFWKFTFDIAVCVAYHLCDQYKITCNVKRNNFYIIWFSFHKKKNEAVKAIWWIYFEILNRNSFKFIIFKNNKTSRIYDILHFGNTFVNKKTRANKKKFRLQWKWKQLVYIK